MLCDNTPAVRPSQRVVGLVFGQNKGFVLAIITYGVPPLEDAANLDPARHPSVPPRILDSMRAHTNGPFSFGTPNVKACQRLDSSRQRGPGACSDSAGILQGNLKKQGCKPGVQPWQLLYVDIPHAYMPIMYYTHIHTPSAHLPNSCLLLYALHVLSASGSTRPVCCDAFC
jgi:hypothetical protein